VISTHAMTYKAFATLDLHLSMSPSLLNGLHPKSAIPVLAVMRSLEDRTKPNQTKPPTYMLFWGECSFQLALPATSRCRERGMIEPSHPIEALFLMYPVNKGSLLTIHQQKKQKTI